MSSKDDPFGPAGKTVIRAPRRAEKSAPAPQRLVPDSGHPRPSQVKDSTVFDPGVGRHAPPGWASGTVIYQGADPGAAAATGSFAATPKPTIEQEILLNATDSVRYSAANQILAAAAPLLMLFGQLRLMPVERQAEQLAEHVAEAIEKFDRTMEKAGVPEEDARIAKFALCETADDLIGNLPWPKKDAWARHSMLSQFFHVVPTGSGFYEALNTILAAPEAHYDLLELMHACLSLGFEGQYRGLTREDNNLERVLRDVYETLRYFRARAGDDISPHWQSMAVSSALLSPRLPLWVVAAAASALLTAVFFALRIFITNEGEALAGRLLALDPSTPIVIERASVVPSAAPVKVAPPVATTPSQIDRIHAALAEKYRARRTDRRHAGQVHRRGDQQYPVVPVRRGRDKAGVWTDRRRHSRRAGTGARADHDRRPYGQCEAAKIERLQIQLRPFHRPGEGRRSYDGATVQQAFPDHRRRKG